MYFGCDSAYYRLYCLVKRFDCKHSLALAVAGEEQNFDDFGSNRWNYYKQMSNNEIGTFRVCLMLSISFKIYEMLLFGLLKLSSMLIMDNPCLTRAISLFFVSMVF